MSRVWLPQILLFQNSVVAVASFSCSLLSAGMEKKISNLGVNTLLLYHPAREGVIPYHILLF